MRGSHSKVELHNGTRGIAYATTAFHVYFFEAGTGKSVAAPWSEVKSFNYTDKGGE